MSKISKPTNENFNYKITKFFLANTRLTIISFILLIALGLISTFLLKTTGFPTPELKTAFITTIYPNASSETVNREITIPLEGAIKNIDGIESFSSSSGPSFSRISATIYDSADANTVKGKIQTAINSVTIPSAAQKPQLGSFDIGGPDYIFSINANSLETTYNTYEKLKLSLEEIPETSQIKTDSPIKKSLQVLIDKTKIEEYGIKPSDITDKLKLVNENFPVVGDVVIDSKIQGISTQIKETTLESIKNLTFSTQSKPLIGESFPGPVENQQSKTYKLQDLSKIDYTYTIDDTSSSQIGVKDVDKKSNQINTAYVFKIKTRKNTDQSAYQKTVEEKINTLDNVVFNPKGDYKKDDQKTHVIEHFTISEQNKNQVDEVIEGLVGGPLKIQNKSLANIGWLLGGIQLVFIVMVLFVSWRAAIVAALSIPMSLVFSNIYLYFTGESFNTLVLFSLVLVIGLVVDPALVILESIQRKIDIGLKGKEAALEAVKDVGNGLFLATLTNVIVFLPFGIISGVLGQIFRYIPLTIIPATIGSYVVPLIFLAWIGSFVLKKNKNTSHNEEDNLWGIAKWLVRFNERLLYGSRFLRLFIIVGALVVSLFIANILISNKRVRAVQFSQGQNGPLLTVTGSYNSSTTKEEKKIIIDQIIEKLLKDDSILDVYPFSSQSDIFLYANLKNVIDRPNTKSVDIAKNLNDSLSQERAKLFDLTVGVDSNGPAADAFSVAISIKSPDLAKIKNSSLNIADTLKNKTCINTESKEITVQENGCPDKQVKIVDRIDDGFTNRENRQIGLSLNRATLESKNLVIPGAPASILVNQTIKNEFTLNGRDDINIEINGSKIPLDIAFSQKQPATLESIKNIEIPSLSGKLERVVDIALIEPVESKATISRVKGQTVAVVKAKLVDAYNDQAFASQVTTAVEKYYANNQSEKSKSLGLEAKSITSYSEGGSASFAKSFQDLITALLLAIVLTYLVLAVFFNSLTQPLVILYTIPLTFAGIFPALGWIGTGEFGFLEIIGMIILVGLVENVAIFLIDAANQNINAGMEEKRAMALASGIRFRPVILTKITAIASLAPLAFLSEFYRSISLVIIFGLLASGFVSLITTPILFVFFKWLSREYIKLGWLSKILFFPFFPIYIIYMGLKDKPEYKAQ